MRLVCNNLVSANLSLFPFFALHIPHSERIRAKHSNCIVCFINPIINLFHCQYRIQLLAIIIIEIDANIFPQKIEIRVVLFAELKCIEIQE